jgi:predicted dehydrogenase
MKKINVALIGYGYWGQRLYRYLKAHPGLNLKYVCALSLKEEGEFINDIDKIWRDDDVRAVIIATPIDTHYQIAKKALLAHKHVLCEKPLVLRSKQALELKEIAEERRLLILTEFTYTFSKSLGKAKKIIEGGEIGEINSIELSLKYAGRFLKYDVYWLLGSHLLSILDNFVPLRSLKFSKFDLIKNKDRVETGSILFKNGKISGKMTVSLNYPDKDMKVIIYGRKGTLVYSTMSEPSLKYFCYKKTEGVLGEKLIIKERSYFIDEKNNLKLAVQYLYDALTGRASGNIERAIMVTKILESKGRIKIK